MKLPLSLRRRELLRIIRRMPTASVETIQAECMKLGHRPGKLMVVKWQQVVQREKGL